MTGTTDYEKVFRHRGASYHKAMVDFPGIRAEEFRQLFSRFPLSKGERVIDCPALGGYLERNVTVPIKVESLDFCPQDSTVKLIDNLNLTNGANRVVCLASSHHINNLNPFLSGLSQMLRPGGVMHLADVGEDSPIRYFLDDFVGQWTSTGHSGIWRPLRNPNTFDSVEGVRLVCAEERECPWVFQSVEQMVAFCRLLFGLDLNPSDQQIAEALYNHVGLLQKDGKQIVPWRLTYVDFTRK